MSLSLVAKPIKFRFDFSCVFVQKQQVLLFSLKVFNLVFKISNALLFFGNEVFNVFKLLDRLTSVIVLLLSLFYEIGVR